MHRSRQGVQSLVARQLLELLLLNGGEEHRDLYLVAMFLLVEAIHV